MYAIDVIHRKIKNFDLKPMQFENKAQFNFQIEKYLKPDCSFLGKVDFIM